MPLITCSLCGKKYPDQGNPFRCECGGTFDFEDFPLFENSDRGQKGLWAYQKSLGLTAYTPCISLGEGNTPLVRTTIDGGELWLKMESQNPTGSYKDRGSTVLVSHLKSRGVKFAIEDSSGNAGASFAAYCTRGGIACKIFVPESASGPKRTQIEFFGADLVRVPGPRAEAAKAVLLEAKSGAVYGSHAFMPFGLTGIATISYELVVQLGEEPATVIAPVGHGGLLYGIMRGFEALKFAGVIRKEPFYVGVQPENCAPIVRAYMADSLIPIEITPGETIAEGVKVASPMRGAAILRRMQNDKGKMVSVSENQLNGAYQELAKQGFYCEPTSALVWAAARQVREAKISPTVAVITGSGYKSTLNQIGIV
jgi:threonine synthase